MTDFLIRHFVRDYDKTNDIRVRESYGILSSVVGIICNIIIFTGKFIMGTLTHSISIISDGFNNVSDCASCIVTMLGYKLSAKPADREHPFGHGRMEYLTSLVIAAVIVAVGCELLITSVKKIIRPDPVTYSGAALIVLILSMAIKVWMGFFNKKMGIRINSSIMLATSKDSFSDVFATLATAVALLASLITDAPVDGIMGAAVSALILISGVGIIRDTVDLLIGKRIDGDIVEKLRKMVSESPIALGMHDLIIHSYGPENMIGSVHVEVDAANPILEIHDAIDVLERNIKAELGIEMTIHMDPVEVGNKEIDGCRTMVEQLISEISPKLTIHDFRVVSGPTHSNLIFDILVPYDFSMSNQDIKSAVDEKLGRCEKKYYAVITFDKSYY